MLKITSLFLFDKYNTPNSLFNVLTSFIISYVVVSLNVKSYSFELDSFIQSENADTQKE